LCGLRVLTFSVRSILFAFNLILWTLSLSPPSMTVLSEEPPVVAKKSQPWDSFLANSVVPQGQTDELLTWLSKVNQKKFAVRGKRDRDLRKEAMLEHARVAAQAELERKQRSRLARWRNVMTSLTPPPSPPHEEESLCDCETCVLCLRHKSSMFGKCYCNVIFSPRPVFMDFNTPLVSASDAFSDDQTSIEADKFLASLSSKRKAEQDEMDETLVHKRAKA